jgi:signal transduction histidine kinase/CheY-like chemotaxis protein
MSSENQYKERISELEGRIRELETELSRLSTGKKESPDSTNVAEQRLRRSEIASRSGNWELHLDNMLMHASEGALLLYGVSKSPLYYNDISGIPLPEYRPLLDNAIKELIHNDKPYKVDFKIRNAKSGKVIDVHSTAVYDKKTNRIFGIVRDISSQVTAEELIKRKNSDLSLLLAATMELLEITDKRQILTNILETTKKLVGLDTGAVYSITDDNLFLEATIPSLPPDFPDEFRFATIGNHPHIKKAIETRQPVIVEDVAAETFSEHEKVIIENRNFTALLYNPLIAAGKNYGVIILGSLEKPHYFDDYEVSLCRTISNIATVALENAILINNLKHARDKAEESDKLKTAFLHNISHEIRTPLNAIIGFSEFLAQPEFSGEDRKAFHEIINMSSTQLLNIINDIFNASQIEAGQIILSEQPADIASIIMNLHALYIPLAQKNNLRLTVKNGILPVKGQEVLCDEKKLVQVLSNLLNNALKFTQAGEIVFGCSRTDDKLSFFVRDTGIGIPETEHKRIFERFYQVDKSGTRAYSGAGLGLSISEAFVQLMGGTIRVESEPGKGSVFTFDIPCRIISADRRNNSRTEPKKEFSVSKRSTLLIAEDEIFNFELIEQMLKGYNLELLHATNGKEAVDVCTSRGNIDIILMDIKMPIMDGFEAATEIRKLNSAVPIIAQTAFTTNADRERALESGCSDFLAKPYSKAQLLSVLQKHLEK